MFYLGYNLYSVNYISENCLNWCIGYDCLNYGLWGWGKLQYKCVTVNDILPLKNIKILRTDAKAIIILLVCNSCYYNSNKVT